ncbi:BTAD domain-containing putative transcriptional regulator [Actinopolymorpha rutila]|uniref:DNA-binding SARP family transcriptional activator n=1 Tax=Actinopolymorpha rutila TaxID=446787 RepID=A0A852ZCX4_9ACTN|nr:BTAD domain-containing putative transcriptional regulator [Actinopolymorpha rutila]NYH87549.1 DNA-binding SARP family transcriptional activator [Actinopolymorpha rutila]
MGTGLLESGDVGVDRIEVRLLGPLRVRRPDGSIVPSGAWRTGKTTDLLRLLALNAGEPVPAMTLTETLWPSVDESRARASLRTAASQIRKVVGVDCVGRRSGGLVLLDAWVDAVAFTGLAAEAARAYREGRYADCLTATREAEALYVDAFRAYDVDSVWASEHRERLAVTYLSLLSDAADAAVALGWMHDAVEFASRVLAIDSWSERAYRALMYGHGGLGQTALALRTFERCRAVLAEELGADPSPQTRAVHLHLLSADPVTHTECPFVGRTAESRWLGGIVRSTVANGLPSIVHLGGEPGVGRSALVTEVCRALGVRLVRADGDGPNSTRADLVDRVVASLDQRPDGAEPPERLAAAMSRSAPTVVLLRESEDAPSAYRNSLCRAVLRATGPVVVVLVTGTGKDTCDLLYVHRDGTEADRVHRLDLPPLDATELTELAEGLLAGTPTEPLVAELLSISAGLPGRAMATLNTWSRRGRIVSTPDGLALMPARELGVATLPDVEDPAGRIVDGHGDADSGSASGSGLGSAPQSILARAFDQLDAESLTVLQYAALLDRPLTPELLVPLLRPDGGPDDDPGSSAGSAYPAGGPAADAAAERRRVQARLDRLIDLGLLVRDARGAAAFRDPLRRSAVRYWLRPTVRQRLHGRIAAQAPIPTGERVHHWLRAGEPQLAFLAAVDAANEAAAEGLLDQARDFLLRARALGPSDSDALDRADLDERIADTEASIGRREEARETYASALRIARAHDLPVESRIVRKLRSLDDPPGRDAGPAGGSRLIASGGPDGPGRTVQHLPAPPPAGGNGEFGIEPGSPPTAEAERVLRAAVEDADQAGAADIAAHARLLFARIVAFPRRSLHQGRHLAREALALATRPDLRAQALLIANLPDVVLGSPAVVERPLAEAAELAAGEGIHPSLLGRINLMRCLAAHDAGSPVFDTMWADYLAAYPRPEDDPSFGWARVRIHTERGDLEAAQVADRVDLPAASGPLLTQLHASARADLLVALGRPDDAARTTQSLLDQATEDGCILMVPEAAARLVVLRSPADLRAAHQYFDLLDWAIGSEGDLARESCWRLLARAAIRAADSRPAAAAGASALAAHVAESAGLVLLAGRAQLDRARHLADAGSWVDARLAAAAAGRAFRSAGLDHLARAADSATSSAPRSNAAGERPVG